MKQENDDYLFENIKTTLYESDNPYILVLTFPRNMPKTFVEALHKKFSDFKKEAGIDTPFVILPEGVNLSLIERPK